MDIAEIRKLSTEDLNKKIVENKQALFDLRLKQANGTLEKASEIKKLRKTVAKMKTVITEREMGGNK